MESNFSFLEGEFPSLANLGALAEGYQDSDPNSSLTKLGMLGEQMVAMIFKFDRLREPDDVTAVSRINILKREGILPPDAVAVLHLLRKARNQAVHQGWGDSATVKQFLPIIHSLCGWFVQTYSSAPVDVPPYRTELKRTAEIRDLEQQSDELRSADERKAADAKPMARQDRLERSQRASAARVRTEDETRVLIDEQLRQAGWEADTRRLRHSRGTRPTKGRNLAIAEWPTDSTVGRYGQADYALFIGTQLVGVVEAKPEHVDIPSVIDDQASDYSRMIKGEHAQYVIDHWGDFKVPFLFATNGRDYLEQLETKSGIWFRDARRPDNAPRALRGWPRPEGLQRWLSEDIDEADQALRDLNEDFLTDPAGLNLRAYQINAIHSAEDAIAQGRTHALLAMATGTGKTRTILGLIYRMLKTRRFNRILFLVDRTALGEQALDAFKDVKLEELLTLDQLYDIKGLKDTGVETETKVHVATVQAMIKRIMFPGDEDTSTPAVTDYDLIIVDEAHRGYVLDKEMTDDELLYCNQSEYQSAYRYIIDYFDAVKVALTATPALHTTQIFGKPVFTYSYREAVMDGYLVDHDAPHRLTTKLSTQGIRFDKGEQLPLFDPVSGEITNSDELVDEVTFKIDTFNRKVITEDFNRTVLTEIANHIDPTSPETSGKTLIYAVDNAHADLIVKILKEIYSEYGVDSEAIKKITGSSAGGNEKKIQESIRRFKNESYPSMVVTVDLLTTGIDVPSITTLVFMRRVKSRILFEQMLGRATRLCPQIKKEKFEIYDPVGVYESLDPVSTMKPVVTDPHTRFAELIEGIDAASSDDGLKVVIDQIIGKLQRRKRRMKAQAVEQIKDLSGTSDLQSLTSSLKAMTPQDAAAWVKGHEELFHYLDTTVTAQADPIVVSDRPDELLTHTRDFGQAQSSQDYLKEFTAFVRNNVNEIAALTIITTRPADLTREQLKQLRLILDRNGFTEPKLSSAVSQLTNQEITADIISLVRRYSLGSPLLSHEERVQRAFDKLKQGRTFNKLQLGWLDKIQAYLSKEALIQPETFNEDPRFRQEGGFRRFDKALGGQLEAIIHDLNTYMYEDQEMTA